MAFEAFDSFDQWLFRIINQGFNHSLLDDFFGEVTFLGSVVFWLVISGILWAAGRRREAVLLILAVIIGGVIVASLKEWFPRERPFMLIPGVHLLAFETGNAFPSGHVERAFASATILGMIHRRMWPILLLNGIIVALSRIYIGVHWPTDVIFGAILGFGVGLLTLLIGDVLIKRISFLREN